MRGGASVQGGIGITAAYHRASCTGCSSNTYLCGQWGISSL